MTKPLPPIEIRDQRIPGGRLSLSARTTSKVERRKRESAVRALLDQGRLDVIEELRARRLHIADVQRAVTDGDVDRLRPVQKGAAALTLGAAADMLMRKVEATKRDNTIRRYRIRLEDMKRHFGATTPLQDITREMAEAYLHAPKGKRNQPWAPNTQASFKVGGQRLWRMAIELEAEEAERTGRKPRLTANPWQKAEIPDRVQTRASFLMPAEWSEIERAGAGLPQLGLLAVGCLAGLRIGEAINLRTDIDVDLEARLIRVQSRGGAHAWHPKGKGPRANRDVPINDRLYAILRAHKDAGYAGERFFFRPPGKDYPMHYRTAQIYTEKLFTAAGIQYGARKDALTFHSLRHTFASWLAQRGVSVLVIAKLLGDTVKMVVDTYAHLIPENLVEAVGVIDRALET